MATGGVNGTSTYYAGYYTSSILNIPNYTDIFLDARGDPNALFVFQATTRVLILNSANVVLLNGAQAANVYWYCPNFTAQYDGIESNQVGIIVAFGSITLGGGTLNGQAICVTGSVTIASAENITLPTLNPVYEWTSGFDLQFLAYWITPWQITATTNVTFPTSGASVTTYNTGPIGECGTLRIKVSAPCCVIGTGVDPVDTTLSIPVRFSAYAMHIFATCSTNGSINYVSVNEMQEFATFSAGVAYPQSTSFINKQGFITAAPFSQSGTYNGTSAIGNSGSGNNTFGETVEFLPQMSRTSFTQQGKYLGTYIALVAAPLSDLDTMGAWNTASSNLQIGFGLPTFYVCAQDIDGEGQTGPARILRWDNLTSGMQLNVAGKLWVKAIPTSALAPYVKQQVMMQNRWCSDGAIRLVAALCEGATPLRRAWDLKVYQRFVREEIDKLDLQELARLASKDEHIAEAMQSTGLMAALGEVGNKEPLVGIGNFGAAGNFQTHRMGGLIRQRTEYM